MPLRRRSSFGGVRARSARRKTFWIASGDSTAQASLPAATAILDQSFTWTDELGPSTIVRTRGSLWVASDQVAASEEPFGALGFGMVKLPAITAGVASVPTPITEESDDSFFVWMPWETDLLIVTAVSAVRPKFSRYDFDSKAMRKITQGDAIAVTLENASAAHGAVYIVKFRILVMTG